MSYQAKTIRTFIGAKNYNESRVFYQELGFEAEAYSYFKKCKSLIVNYFSFDTIVEQLFES